MRLDFAGCQIVSSNVIAMTYDKASSQTAEISSCPIREDFFRRQRFEQLPGIPSPKSAPDNPRHPFEKIAIRFAEGVGLRAFHVDHAQNAIVFIIDDGHDHLRFCGPEIWKETRLLADIGNHDGAALFQSPCALNPCVIGNRGHAGFILLVAASITNS